MSTSHFEHCDRAGARGRQGPLSRDAVRAGRASRRVCSRSMPSMSRSRACAIWRASRCRARSACNGGARRLAGERDGEAAAHPVAAALRETLARYGLPPRRCSPLIDAHAFDLYDEPMATVERSGTVRIKTQSALFALAAESSAAADAGDLARSMPASPMHRGLLTSLPRMPRAAALRAARCAAAPRVDRTIFSPASSAPLLAALAECASCAQHLAAAQAKLARRRPILPALLPAALVGPRCAAWTRRLRPVQSSRWRHGGGNGAVARGARSEADFPSSDLFRRDRRRSPAIQRSRSAERALAERRSCAPGSWPSRGRICGLRGRKRRLRRAAGTGRNSRSSAGTRTGPASMVSIWPPVMCASSAPCAVVGGGGNERLAAALGGGKARRRAGRWRRIPHSPRSR